MATDTAPPLRTYGLRKPSSRYDKQVQPRAWTAEEDALLRALWARHLSGTRISQQFPGRSRCSVLARAVRIGLEARDRAPQCRNWGKNGPPVNAPLPVVFPRDKQCRWLDGEPSHYRWCAEDAMDGKPYCAAHWKKAWRKPDQEARDFEAPKLSTFALRAGISKSYIGEV